MAMLSRSPMGSEGGSDENYQLRLDLIRMFVLPLPGPGVGTASLGSCCSG